MNSTDFLTEVIFDIETKKLFEEIETNNPADLGVSVVSLYKRKLDKNLNEIEGEMFSFWENDFDKLWTAMSGADRIIGFNSNSFDVPALIPLSPIDLRKMTHFDILEKVKEVLGFRLSLDSIARETLGQTKSDVGTNAVKYWNEGTEESLNKLRKYCEMDVMITKNVYDFGMKNGHLKYKDKWNTPRNFEVDFSYPKKTEEAQMGLF
jgi:DEAD/DEAH box helicase domain-containing protein